MPSVKINDALYERLTAFCKANNIKIMDFCNEAVESHLMDEMYGDAPFMATTFVTDVPDTNGRIYPKEVMEKAVKEFNEKQQISPENKPDFDKIPKVEHKTEEKIDNFTQPETIKPKKRRL